MILNQATPTGGKPKHVIGCLVYFYDVYDVVDMKKPDYDYWLKRKLWTQEQAAFLLSEVDPSEQSSFDCAESRYALNKAVEENRLKPDDVNIDVNLFTPFNLIDWAIKDYFVCDAFYIWYKEQNQQSESPTAQIIRRAFDTNGNEVFCLSNITAIAQAARDKDELQKNQLELLRIALEKENKPVLIDTDKRNYKKTHDRRIAVLIEVSADNPDIDGRFYREEIWDKCHKKSPDLFTKGQTGMTDFFKHQEIITLKRGRPKTK